LPLHGAYCLHAHAAVMRVSLVQPDWHEPSPVENVHNGMNTASTVVRATTKRVLWLFDEQWPRELFVQAIRIEVRSNGGSLYWLCHTQ
jgi:hypothetical protein